MDVISLEFLGFILIGLIIYHALPSLAMKRGILLTFNALFIASFSSGNYTLLGIAIFLALGFAGVHLAHRRVSSLSLALAITFVVFSFAILKRYAILESLTFPESTFVVVGLSYVLFRVLHLMIDVYGGALQKPPSLGAYLRYTCFFLSWVSGPIQRYEDYVAQESTIQSGTITWRLVSGAMSRTATGYFKVGVVSAMLLSGHNLFVLLVDDHFEEYVQLAAYAAAYTCYALYLYYNFAGYMDIVIGLGLLFGFRLPENFNRPFMARNFLDFWSRWHMTLSEWFKFYIFNPLVKVMAYRLGTQRTIPYLGCFAYFCTFLIMGIWHGTTAAYLVFGLFLGFGVSLNKLYQEIQRKRLGKTRFARLSGNPLYGGLCRGLTFSYFAISLTCLWKTSEEMMHLVTTLGLLNIIACFFVVAIISAAAAAAVSGLGYVCGRVSRPMSLYLENEIVHQVYVGAKVYVVAALVVANASAIPEFVYQGF